MAPEHDAIREYLEELDAVTVEPVGTMIVDGREADVVDLVRDPECHDPWLWRAVPGDRGVEMNMVGVDRTRLLFLTVDEQPVIVEMWAVDHEAWFPIAEALVESFDFR